MFVLLGTKSQPPWYSLHAHPKLKLLLAPHQAFSAGHSHKAVRHQSPHQWHWTTGKDVPPQAVMIAAWCWRSLCVTAWDCWNPTPSTRICPRIHGLGIHQWALILCCKLIQSVRLTLVVDDYGNWMHKVDGDESSTTKQARMFLLVSSCCCCWRCRTPKRRGIS